MSEALSFLKALADETRIKIIQALNEKESYVELLSERLHLTPATVSFHLKKLLAAGIVDARREQYYTIYSLRRELLGMTIGQLLLPEESSTSAEALREEMYRRKVIKSFMPDGVCRVMPAQIKKRMIIYEEIMKLFETGKTYHETEVNELISTIHADYCTVRRAFVGMGWMSRVDRIYTVHGVIANSDLAHSVD